MQEIAINGVYSVITTSSGWVIQNTGKQRAYLNITDGTAPIMDPGYILDPGMILRDIDINIAGTVYGRTDKNQHGSVVVNG